MIRNSISLQIAASIAVTLFASTPSRATLNNGLTYTTVAVTGQAALAPAPGTFSSFTPTSFYGIGNRGDVYFNAVIAGPGLAYPNTYGDWAGTPGNLTNILRGGINAPGVDGGLGAGFGPTVSINSQGEFVVSAVLDQHVGYARDDAIWFGTTPNNLQLIVREGDVPPGVESTTVYSDPYLNSSTENFDAVQLNDNSEITFTSFLRGPGVPQFEMGLWSGKAGQLQLIARSNRQAIDLPAGVNYGQFTSPINAHGVLAFEGFLNGPGVDSTNDAAIWAGSPGAIHIVARTGNAAPGIPNASFSALTVVRGLQTDANGNLFFRASVSGAGIDSSNDGGYWYGLPSNPALIFREGQSIPGFNATFKSLNAELIGPNKFAVMAQITGPGVTNGNDSAIFVGSSTQLNLVAREGMPAPGTVPGVLIGDILSFDAAKNGQIAFTTTLTGTGVTSANAAAYFMTDTGGNLFKVIRQGDQFDIGNGILKTVTFPNSNFDDIGPEMFNDSGQLFFAASFSDQTGGMFIAQAVPEPNGLALVCTVAATTCVTRRRPRMLTG